MWQDQIIKVNIRGEGEMKSSVRWLLMWSIVYITTILKMDSKPPFTMLNSYQDDGNWGSIWMAYKIKLDRDWSTW